MKTHEKTTITRSHGILVGMIAASVVCTVITIGWIDFRVPAVAVNFFLSMVALVFTILLYTFCSNSTACDARQKKALSLAATALFLCSLLLLLYSGSENKPHLWRVTMLFYTLLYLIGALYWLCFWLYQRGSYRTPRGEKLVQAIYFVSLCAYCILVVVNYFTGFCFAVLPDGTFVTRSSWMYTLIALWYVVYPVMTLSSQAPIKARLILTSCTLFPMVTWVPLFIWPGSQFYFDIYTHVGALLYLIPLYLLFFNVYLENGRLLSRRERDLEESRATAMALKISPHFISNTMSSIVALCHTDAQQAGELAAKFARYLRDNYTDMTDAAMIPFSEELEHIRNYLAVEQVRFVGLRVEYDIQAERFLLPTLTVQPLVENAVRHGISKRPDASGTVKISSFETETDYVIRIADDGAGYHPAPEPDGKKHVGIANARTRLTLLCAGELTITDQAGQGAVCEIRIPKGAKA